VRRPDRPGGLLRVQGRHRRHEPADRQGPGPAEDPGDDDRAGPVPDAAARRPVRGADRVDRGAGAASGAAGPAGRVRRAGRAHRGEPDAQRRDDPAGRRDQDGPALTLAGYAGRAWIRENRSPQPITCWTVNPPAASNRAYWCSSRSAPPAITSISTSSSLA